MGTGDLCLVPPAAVCHGRAGQNSGTGPYGVQYSEKNRFIEKPGGRHQAKRSSDPQVAYTEVKVQVRDIVRVVDIVAPLPHGVTVPRENSFYRALGGKRAHLCRVPPPPPLPQQLYATGEPGKEYRTRRVSIRG